MFIRRNDDTRCVVFDVLIFDISEGNPKGFIESEVELALRRKMGRMVFLIG